jgi:hypothetical protein
VPLGQSKAAGQKAHARRPITGQVTVGSLHRPTPLVQRLNRIQPNDGQELEFRAGERLECHRGLKSLSVIRKSFNAQSLGPWTRSRDLLLCFRYADGSTGELLIQQDPVVYAMVAYSV